MKVLVTGGAGFVGSHVAETLLAAGHEVRVLDNVAARDVAPIPELDPQIELITGDLRDASTVGRLVGDVDAVCHQAGKVGLADRVADFPAYAEHNDLGTAILLAAMAEAGVSRLVLASSMVVYGEGGYECGEHGRVRPAPRGVADLGAGKFDPGCPTCGAVLEPVRITEDATLDPRNVYAATKVTQEHYAASWARSTGGTVAALRYHNVYGPRMPRDTPYSGVAAIFRSALERGRPPRVFEDGAQRRDFIHVRDVARANLLALTADPDVGAAPDTGTDAPTGPAAFTAFNVASGRPRTILDMAHALAAVYGGPDPVVTGEYRLGDVRHIVAAPERAADRIGFHAEIDLTEGMKELANATLH